MVTKQHITVDAAAKVLAEFGLIVSKTEAETILNYLYDLAKNTLGHEESNIVHTC